MSAIEMLWAAPLAIVGVIGLLQMPKLWRATPASIPPPPPWWVWGEAMWVAVSRSNPHGIVFMLLLAAWGGSEASGLIEGQVVRWSAGVVLGWMVLGLVIVLFNRPRVLVPPALRGEPGAIGYRRAHAAFADGLPERFWPVRSDEEVQARDWLMRERFPEAYPLLERVLEEIDPSHEVDHSCVVAEVLTLLGVQVIHSEAAVRPWVWPAVKRVASMCLGEEPLDDLVRDVNDELARRGFHTVVERENLPVRIVPPHDRAIAGVLRRGFPPAHAELAASGDDLDAVIDSLMLRWHGQHFGDVSGGPVTAL